MARQEIAVSAAASRIPHAGPTRSTRRPAGIEPEADMT
jgi:hypothetical protein